MPDASLALAFGLPPARALEYFRRKGYALTWDYRGLAQQAHAHAFTVAKNIRVDVLQEIRGAVERAIAEGETLATFQRNLEPRLRAMGWWGRQVIVDAAGNARVGEIGSPWRLATIYRTNLQAAFMAGRYAAFKENEAARPFWQYVAVMDGKTRPAHAALNGKVFRSDDPFWRHFYPPNGYNCRCRVRALSADDVERRGLKPSSSIHHIKEDVQVDRDGVEYPSALMKVPGMSHGVRPDRGFAYNPGAAAAKPFTPPPIDPDNPFYVLLPQTMRDGDLPPPLPAGRPVAAADLYPDGLAPRELAERFLADFGASIDKPIVFRDVLGEALAINADLLTNPDGSFKTTKGSRASYLGLVGRAIREPDEIWMRWEESRSNPGQWFLRRRYIAAFELEGGQYGLAVFEDGQNGWRGVTAFTPAPERTPAARQRYIDQYRGGFLLYARRGD